MSLLFADIFEAIQCLRLCKGTTEKDIMNYIQERVGGCLSVGNVLKTISCLNKLVCDGVLVKKGKRYMFPRKCEPKKEEEEEDEDDDEEEEEEEDECDAEDECDKIGDEDEEEDEEEEEEEEDDDEDDEEEEEEDDDDEDECDDKVEEMPQSQSQPQPQENPETTSKPTVMNSKSKNGCEPPKEENKGSDSDVCDDAKFNGKNGSQRESSSKNESLRKMRNGSKGKFAGSNGNCNGRSREGEKIAFCVRDFIDSQCCQRVNAIIQDKPKKKPKPPQEVTEVDEKDIKTERLFSVKSRNSRSKRSNYLKNNSCRSRSPITRNTAELYHNLKMEKSHKIGPDAIHSQLFNEPMDTEMEIDRDMETGYDLFRHRSPTGPPPPNTPGVHVDRKESCCSEIDKKPTSEMKIEVLSEGEHECCLKKELQSALSLLKDNARQSKRFAKDGAEKATVKQKKEPCRGDENREKDSERNSLCSVCEKKKRNS